MNSAAFYDALNCMSMAVLLMEGGTPSRVARADHSFLEASLAAAGAFPEGSPEAEALGILLTAISRMDRVTEGAAP